MNGFAQRIHSPPSFNVEALQGEFTSKVPYITKALGGLSKSFQFIFLDPKGWADIPMLAIRQILILPNTEVLITLMTSHMARFLEEESRAESYNALYGRPGVLENICAAGSNAEARVEASVREYCISLRELCKFTFVSQAVILEPEEEKIRYFLIYATNHPRGVSVFKSAERNASILQTEIRNRKFMETSGAEHLSFGPLKSKKESELGRRYTHMALAKILQELIREGAQSRPVSYIHLFCEAMAFPYVVPDDLQEWLEKLDDMVKITLQGGGSKRKKLSTDKDKSDYVTLFWPAAMEACLSELNAIIKSGKFLSAHLRAANKPALGPSSDGQETQSDFGI